MVLQSYSSIRPVLEEFRDYDSPLLFRTAIQIAFDNVLGTSQGDALLDMCKKGMERVKRKSPPFTDNTDDEIIESMVELARLVWKHYRYQIRNRYEGIEVIVLSVELRNSGIIIQVEYSDV